VSEIIGYGITREESPHHRSNRDVAGAQKQVKMVGDQHPGVTECFGLSQDTAQAVDEVRPILIILEYRLPADSSSYHMVQCSGSVYAGSAWHDLLLADYLFQRKFKC